MPKRIDSLTDEMRATFPDWEAKWLAKGLKTGPLSEGEWDRVGLAAIAAARFSSLSNPILIRCSSPLGAAIAAPVAAFVAASASKRSGVRSGVESGVWSGVGSGVGSGVWSGVWSGVESGVWSGVEEWLHVPIKEGLAHAVSHWSSAWIGGHMWAGDLSFLSWFRDVGHLELDGDLWERFAAYEGICEAGPSFWHRFGDRLIVAFSDRPTELRVDRNGVSHAEDGPAIVYEDGWTVNSWHGVVVPEDFFGWDVERVLREENSEIRRCGIERVGWENLTDKLSLVAEAPDPGNAPHTLRLFEGELLADLYEEPARLLVATNGSVDKGGHRRVFGLPVPGDVSDPVQAAALLFDVPVDVYASLARRS